MKPQSALAKARSAVNEPCQDQEDKKHLSWSPQEGDFAFECDISVHDNCDSQLQSYGAQVVEIFNGLQLDVEEGGDAYAEAKHACDTAKADVVKKQNRLDEELKAWQQQRESRKSSERARSDVMCQFGKALQNKCLRVAAYNDVISRVNAVNGSALAHSDRLNEWKVSQVVQCLLESASNGKLVDEATLKTCGGSVNYDGDVGVLDLQAEAVAALTDADTFTCTETAISFRGEQWTFPTGEKPKSSDYKIEPFKPDISLGNASSPFSFCPQEDDSWKSVDSSWEKIGGNPDCGVGSSTKLRDAGVGISLDSCLTACQHLEGCTDMTWAPQNQHCALFDGCEGAGGNQNWKHYERTFPMESPNSTSRWDYVIVANSHRRNEKTVTVHANLEKCNAQPVNPQHHSWRDQFKIDVKPGKLIVKRTDANVGWGQNLVLQCYGMWLGTIKGWSPPDPTKPGTRGCKDIAIGNSRVNPMVTLVEANLERCNNKPVNAQWHGWNDAFVTTPQPGLLSVYRTDANVGWGQKLVLNCCGEFW